MLSHAVISELGGQRGVPERGFGRTIQVYPKAEIIVQERLDDSIRPVFLNLILNLAD